MSRLLVTGAAGFIGANFVHYWRREHPGDYIVAYDALTYAGNRANLAALEGSEGFRFVHADIRERERVEALLVEEQLDTIVHFAAESHVDRSIAGPDPFIETNVAGTHALLQAARAAWVDRDRPHRFHHVSTDEVYGSLAPEAPGFREGQAYSPRSPYSASKAASDHLVSAWHNTWGLQVSTSHCGNNHGPWQHPEKLIPRCLVNILRGRPIPVYGDGLHIRDWLYVEDHCAALECILQADCVGATYNIGGNAISGNDGGDNDGGDNNVRENNVREDDVREDDVREDDVRENNVRENNVREHNVREHNVRENRERTNLEVIHRLCERLPVRLKADPARAGRFPDSPAAAGDARALILHVEDRPGHDRRYAIDAGKIRRELGFAPRCSFEEGIDRTIDWFLDHPDWWEPLVVD